MSSFNKSPALCIAWNLIEETIVSQIEFCVTHLLSVWQLHLSGAYSQRLGCCLASLSFYCEPLVCGHISFCLPLKVLAVSGLQNS